MRVVLVILGVLVVLAMPALPYLLPLNFDVCTKSKFVGGADMVTITGTNGILHAKPDVNGVAHFRWIKRGYYGVSIKKNGEVVATAGLPVGHWPAQNLFCE